MTHDYHVRMQCFQLFLSAQMKDQMQCSTLNRSDMCTTTKHMKKQKYLKMPYLFNRYKWAKIIKLIKFVRVIGVSIRIQHSSEFQVGADLFYAVAFQALQKLYPEHCLSDHPSTHLQNHKPTDFSKARKSIAETVSRTLFVGQSSNISHKLYPEMHPSIKLYHISHKLQWLCLLKLIRTELLIVLLS